MISSAWDTLREKFNMEERCDKPSCVDGVSGGSNMLVYPPDRSQIGRANWKYAHLRSESFPENPSDDIKRKELQWIQSFVYTYPCSVCAKDFLDICGRLPPQVDSRSEYRHWWIRAHNEVNRDLSKPQYRP